MEIFSSNLVRLFNEYNTNKQIKIFKDLIDLLCEIIKVYKSLGLNPDILDRKLLNNFEAVCSFNYNSNQIINKQSLSSIEQIPEENYIKLKKYFDNIIPHDNETIKDNTKKYNLTISFLTSIEKKVYEHLLNISTSPISISHNLIIFNDNKGSGLKLKTQTGGNYYEKYMKYKTKYLELKKIRDSKLNY